MPDIILDTTQDFSITEPAFSDYYSEVVYPVFGENIVSHYKFFDASDTRNTNNGTAVDSVELNAPPLVGVGGGSANFSENYISVDPFHFVQRTGIFTISVYFDYTFFSGGKFLVGNSLTSSSEGFGISVDGAYNFIFFGLNSTGGLQNLIGPLPEDGIHHLVITADGTTGKMYLDAEEVASKALTFGDSPDPVNYPTQIGSYGNPAFPFYWDGRIDELTIANAYASPENVTTLFNA